MTNYITKTIKNGVEANIPVTSVNWQYGDVTIQTGGNYTAGNWIDITNDEIWLDGTYEYPDYSAMQWPAPAWFYVPSKDEWVALCWILTSTFWLAQNATTMGTYLKMPMAGFRRYDDADVSDVGSFGFYWSSTPSNANYAYNLGFDSSDIYPQNYIYRSYGFSVRCFKNSPVIPTSNWTKLYWTSIESWWIFWSSADWLISLSSDWITWITIADKNLWATTVWNSWDTLSETNCGKYYQWGNNYWFPRTWTVTTSSTRVNASTYWPWNYYSSSTFITVSSSPYRWDSTDNGNLRWWETWVQTASWNLVINDSAGPKSIVKVRWWTQAQYDALTTKDPNTLYFTTES